MFDNVFDLKYGVAGLCVLLTLFIFLEVFKVFWSMREKKDSESELAIKNLTALAKENIAAIKHLEASLAEVQKLKIDIRRFYNAIKILAGPEKWATVRDEILAEDKLGK